MTEEVARKYAVYSPSIGWLVDTCAGGTFSWDAEEAIWFDTHIAAQNALKAAEIELPSYQIIRMK